MATFTTNDHDPAACKVILAGTVARSLLSEIQEGLSKLDQPPHLVGFLANDDPGAKMYADWTSKTCLEKHVIPLQISQPGLTPPLTTHQQWV